MAPPLIASFLAVVLAAPAAAAPGRTAPVEAVPQTGTGGSAGNVKIVPVPLSLTVAPLSPGLVAAPLKLAPATPIMTAPAAPVAPAAAVMPLHAPADAPVAEAALAASLGPADPAASVPMKEARSRAGAVIRTERGVWTAKSLRQDALKHYANDDPSPTEVWAGALRQEAATLRLAARGRRLERTPLQARYIRPKLLEEAAAREAQAARVSAEGLDAEPVLKSAVAKVDPARRAQLEELRRYVPGLDPSRAAIGESELARFNDVGVAPGG